MLKRARSTRIASGSVGMNGTRISSTFDGKCVNTIVLIRPMRAARRAADSAETAARMFAPKKIAPSSAGSAPNRRWNQYASRLWVTRPPAKASSENSAESRKTTSRDRWSPKRPASGDRASAGTSTLSDTRLNPSASAAPSAA